MRQQTIGGRSRTSWVLRFLVAVLVGPPVHGVRGGNPPAVQPARAFVLFDATKAETAGNADWIVDGMGTGITREAEVVPQPEEPGLETDWSGALSAWAVELRQRGFDINSLKRGQRITFGDGTNPTDLSKYSVFIVPEPNIRFTDQEKRAILQFVEQGGGLFMIADHSGSDRDNDGMDSVQVWNDLMNVNAGRTNVFGLQFDANDVSGRFSSLGDTSDVHVTAVLKGLAGQVTEVRYHAGATVSIDPSANSNARGVVFREGSSPQGLQANAVALSRSGRGRVVAVGDSSMCDDGTGDPDDLLSNGWEENGSSHRELFINATIWLSQASLPPSLPALIGVDPTTVSVGSEQTINIFGRNTRFTAGVTQANFGANIHVGSLLVISARLARATVRVDPGATGTRDVILTTLGETVAAREALQLRSSPPPVLIINEALVRVPTDARGDANGDGQRDSAEDEFVELINPTLEPAEIGGFELAHSNAQAGFVFPAGTVIPPGEAAVIFGAIQLDSTPLELGNARAFRLVFGSGLPAPYLGFSNTSDSVVVRRTKGGQEVARLDYTETLPVPQPSFQSLNRNPDITGPFENHTAVQGAGGRLFSPGTRADGRPFTRTILAVTPSGGSISGGSTITISGRGFGRSVSSVTFGDQRSLIFRRVNSLQILATLPAGLSTGRVDVTVNDELGRVVAVDAFDYLPRGGIQTPNRSNRMRAGNDRANMLRPLEAGKNGIPTH